MDMNLILKIVIEKNMRNSNIVSLFIKILDFALSNSLEISCKDPPLLQNSTMVGPTDITGTRYEDTATYSCIEGYKITGTISNSSKITCQRDKTWSTLTNCSSE